MKYNYKKASDIFKRYYELICNPWDFDDNERQTTRRGFMRALTRHDMDYLKLFVNCIEDEKRNVCITETNTSRFYDFDMMKIYNQLISDIINF
jgi:hypothetical protein